VGYGPFSLGVAVLIRKTFLMDINRLMMMIFIVDPTKPKDGEEERRSLE
jgi:hypothetical protein